VAQTLDKLTMFFVAAITLAATNIALSDTPLVYKSATATLADMRAKTGVKTYEKSGWTIIEDRSTMSVWSFTPSNHPAHPAAIQRSVVKDGDNIFVQMKVLCESSKSACDAMVVEFQHLDQKVREDLKSR